MAVAAGFAATSCAEKSNQSEEQNMYQINFSAESPNPKKGKYVVMISSSPRRGGNTDLLCDEFGRGAAEACADTENASADGAVAGFRGFVRCLPNPTERGMVKALGMGRKGGVKGSPYMQQAYDLGKGV